MKVLNVKLNSLIIENVRNVKYGKIDILNKKTNSCITGIYGQNGSGKTALIDSIEIIQYLMEGLSLDNSIFDYISVKTKHSKIESTFLLEDNKKTYNISYMAELKYKKQRNSDFYLSNECLRINDGAGSVKIICDFDADENDSAIFAPKVLLDELTRGDKSFKNLLQVQKLISKERKQSFIFNDKVVKLLGECNKDLYIISLIRSLQKYAKMDLFVIKNSHSGIISLNALLPLSFRLEKGNQVTKGDAPVRLDQPTVLPIDEYDDLKEIIKQLNIVLRRIVPNLKLEIYDHGQEVIVGGVGRRFEILSNTDNISVPLRNESEGVKKIISILSALIAFYNKRSVTVVIDELDASIFEYLLGELLQVLNENGLGQLIFTSHNLRPLEVLEKENVYLTTCNPANRYIKPVNIKPNNNLRDFYYRTIELGGQKEDLFDETNLSELSIALNLAGKNESKH